MTTEATTNTAPLDEWATARSGAARVRLYDRNGTAYAVYALDGHELLPRTRSFPHTPAGERDARTYANTLWASL